MNEIHDLTEVQPDLARLVDKMHELAIRLVDAMDAGLVERGLSRARADVLLVLHGVGPMPQRRLAELLRCSPRNVTALIDGLSTTGLVERLPHPTDRRAVAATLTTSGRALAARLRSEQSRAGAALFAGSTPAELATFGAVLDRLLDRC